MTDPGTRFACPHCLGINLRESCLQPVIYSITYIQGPDGTPDRRWPEYLYVADYVAEPRELSCDDCNLTLAESELVAAS